MSDKYKNTYCPICLWTTDANGDHWQGCEYEAEMNGKELELRPLTELEMLGRRIDESKATIKRLNKQIRNVRSSITIDKDRIQRGG